VRLTSVRHVVVSGNNDTQLQQRVMQGMGICQRELARGKTPRIPRTRQDKDLYGVLRVASDASDAEIKQAYRKQALAHHPDKHQGKGEDAVRAAESQFKAIGEAYAVLSDTEQRRRYDAEGHDAISWNDLFPAGGGIDANEVWEHFKRQAGAAGAAFADRGPEGVRVMMPTSPADIDFGMAAPAAESSPPVHGVIDSDR
jgi:curved DNA-binding protein CbpA